MLVAMAFWTAINGYEPRSGHSYKGSATRVGPRTRSVCSYELFEYPLSNMKARWRSIPFSTCRSSHGRDYLGEVGSRSVEIERTLAEELAIESRRLP